MPNEILRALVDLRDRQIQKARIQFNNRLAAIDRQTDDPAKTQQRQTVERWMDVFETLEKTLDKDIAFMVKYESIYDELSSIRGIGPLLAAKILSMLDVHRAGSVSAFWRYSGYGVGDYWCNGDGKPLAPKCGHKWVKEGEEKVLVKTTPQPEPGWHLEQMRDRPVEGWVLPYNKRLKTTLYLIGASFLKSRSPYRSVYDTAKVTYEARGYKKAHAHQAAMRKMIKIFLAHLWERWRLAEGLPIRAAYVHDQLGHEHVHRAEDFGWGGGAVKCPKSTE